MTNPADIAERYIALWNETDAEVRRDSSPSTGRTTRPMSIR